MSARAQGKWMFATGSLLFAVGALTLMTQAPTSVLPVLTAWTGLVLANYGATKLR